MLMTLYLGNGERIPIERWVWEMYHAGTLTDPLLLGLFVRAVEIREGFGWPRPGDYS